MPLAHVRFSYESAMGRLRSSTAGEKIPAGGGSNRSPELPQVAPCVSFAVKLNVGCAVGTRRGCLRPALRRLHRAATATAFEADNGLGFVIPMTVWLVLT